jgi:2C-methyl-D-erythritol 2,4-cyclodiphosphate synthase
LYIPQKEYPKSRLRFFKRLEKRVKKEHIGYIGSSEGVHVYTHEINEFNRGVYHTAMLCQLPVFALYIYTPEASNPMAKFKPFKKGTIFIDLIDIIETKDWSLENLDAHIEGVRAKYILKDQQIKLEYGK